MTRIAFSLNRATLVSEGSTYDAKNFNPSLFLTARPGSSLEDLEIELVKLKENYELELTNLIRSDYMNLLKLLKKLNLFEDSNILETIDNLLKKLSLYSKYSLEEINLEKESLNSILNDRQTHRAKKNTLKSQLNLFQLIIKLENLTQVKSTFYTNAAFYCNDKQLERVCIEINSYLSLSQSNSELAIIKELQARFHISYQWVLDSLKSRFINGCLSYFDSQPANFGGEILNFDRGLLSFKYCCRMFNLTQSNHELEQIFVKQFLEPKYIKIVNNFLLNNFNLDKFYADILEFYQTTLRRILYLAASKNMNEGDLWIDSVFTSLNQTMLQHFGRNTNYPLLGTSIINPKVFQVNFNLTLKFLEDFEVLLPNLDVVIKFRQSSIYDQFLNNFKFDRYRKIMFKNLVIQLDGCFPSNFNELNNPQFSISSDYKKSFGLLVDKKFNYAPGYLTLWGVGNNWSSEAYINLITNSFWKLSLQTIRRYDYWLESCIRNHKQNKLEIEKKIKVHLLSDATNLIEGIKAIFLKFIHPKLLPYLILEDESSQFEYIIKRLTNQIQIKSKLIQNEL
ncbi:hypothetical protein CONCODRAFT_165603 [Conidiobolus coronatus NRRL 28638]|uniref:COG complex component COG2 C-terminal domain-containing protein n=1 Tax=Conidiobolus coronatus (strain ATCC 28846 / CBS 209.66 / NRRL 28638) TaxID=796925 RepID=A0A137P3M7_CONC2|nr:hypothetical protein CONCODRAFT_165603 [Conidiobolus coronatus NRRL 28638]|eukprot:KXN69549.1 hypothetical protein CONCODRAFT_165603 [Conidiobolus coronatus NRRL 28638]